MAVRSGDVTRRVLTAVAAAVFAVVVLAAEISVPAPTTTSPAPSGTAAPSEQAPARLAAFFASHPPRTPAAPAAYGWLLTDRTGVVVRKEDDTVAAALLADIGSVYVSPGARHLSYVTAEPRGVRQLHIFDTVGLTPPLVALETEYVGKLVPAYSPDERFAAIVVPDRPRELRVVDLISGDAAALTLAPTMSVIRWIADGVVLAREGSPTYTLIDPQTGTTTEISQADPRLTAQAPSKNIPGTSAVTADATFRRPDGTAATYLKFDSTKGGRWYGERVESSGLHVPVEWTTGGNPVQQIYVGTSAPVTATLRYESAPPRDADGKLGEARALWFVRQSVSGPVTREAVRAVKYADYLATGQGGSTAIPADATVYVVVIQANFTMATRAGPLQCGAMFALLRSDDPAGPGVGGGCSAASWPTNLPPAFATADPFDWTK